MQGSDIISYLAKSHPHVVLVAISKNRDIGGIQACIHDGIKHIGESYLQEASQKLIHVDRSTISTHFVGHLQSRKVGQAVALFDVIQSVDSLKLAKKIDTQSRKIGKVQKIMLQLNVMDEEGKYGFSLSNTNYQIPNTKDSRSNFTDVITYIESLENIQLFGFMCMGKKDDDVATRLIFRTVRHLVTLHGLEHCSMGMSGDWQIALEEGSTMLRIGRSLFD